MLVKAILDEKGPDLISVSEGSTVQKAAQLFKMERIGFAVVENGMHVPVGAISERDIVQAIADRGDLSGLPVADIMTPNLVSVSPEDTLETVREIMTEKRTRHVLVKEHGAIMGVVSIGDLIKHSLNECKIDTVQMRDYINGQGYQ